MDRVQDLAVPPEVVAADLPAVQEVAVVQGEARQAVREPAPVAAPVGRKALRLAEAAVRARVLAQAADREVVLVAVPTVARAVVAAVVVQPVVRERAL
jgi:hypothetical protein